MIAWLIDVINHSKSFRKLFVENSPQTFTLSRVVPKRACSSDSVIVSIDDKAMIVEKLILIDGHAIFSVRRWLIALPRICAGVPHQNALKTYLRLGIRQFVSF